MPDGGPSVLCSLVASLDRGRLVVFPNAQFPCLSWASSCSRLPGRGACFGCAAQFLGELICMVKLVAQAARIRLRHVVRSWPAVIHRPIRCDPRTQVRARSAGVARAWFGSWEPSVALVSSCQVRLVMAAGLRSVVDRMTLGQLSRPSWRPSFGNCGSVRDRGQFRVEAGPFARCRVAYGRRRNLVSLMSPVLG